MSTSPQNCWSTSQRYAIKNCDRNAEIAVLASHIYNYARTMPHQAMITEFESILISYPKFYN